MRPAPLELAEKGRVRHGFYASEPGDRCGAFAFRLKPGGPTIKAIASDGCGWEHVSVSIKFRCPWWDEMSAVKDLFFDPEETVMQLHPPRSQWVNNMPFCLHLWRPASVEIPRPPQWMVGRPDEGVLTPERAAQLQALQAMGEGLGGLFELRRQAFDELERERKP